MRSPALLLLPLAMVLISPAHGLNCDSTVADNAHVLSSESIERLTDVAGLLQAKGAEVRVITDEPAGTPEQYVATAQKACASWQSPSGSLRNNLLVFLVFPAHRKMGIFYGSEWKPALDSTNSVIKTQFMGPAFREHNWARGLEDGLAQAGGAIHGFQNAIGHPSQTVVTHQATDFSGLWTVFKWGLLLIALVVAVTLLLAWRRRKAFTVAWQQNAVNMKAKVARKLREVDFALKTKEALNVDVKQQRQSYDSAIEDFAAAANSEKMNPETNGLGAVQYEAIYKEYERISSTFAAPPLAGPLSETKKPRTVTRKSATITRDPVRAQAVNSQPAAAQPIRGTYDDYSFLPAGGSIYAPVVVIDQNTYSNGPASEAGSQAPLDSSWGGSSSVFDDLFGSTDSGGSSSDFGDSGGSGDSGGGSDSF